MRSRTSGHETLPKNYRGNKHKTVGLPSVEENEIGVQRGECSWESLQKDPTQWESADEHGQAELLGI